MLCVTTMSYSVLVNDNTVGLITPGRGLRQGIHYHLTFLFCVRKGHLLLSLQLKIEARFMAVKCARVLPIFLNYSLQMIAFCFLKPRLVRAELLRKCYLIMR